MYKFISHRGNNYHTLAENSKEAIIKVLNEEYIYGVEFDIRITKDNKFVIHHNATINLTIDKVLFIKNKTLKELKKIDFKNNGNIYKICELNELLKNIKSDKLIIIEIKEENDYSNYQIHKLLSILKKYNNLNIYLCSFNYKLIKKINEKINNIPCGPIIGKVLNKKKDYSFFDFISIHWDVYLTIETTIKKFIWTINDIKKLNKNKNDEFIISDNAYKFINE